MRNVSTRFSALLWAAAAAILLASCTTATPAEHSFVTGYQVVGDQSIKYIYLPGDQSRAGTAYLDQGLAIEICTLSDAGGAMEETNCKQTRVLKTEEYR